MAEALQWEKVTSDPRSECGMKTGLICCEAEGCTVGKPLEGETMTIVPGVAAEALKVRWVDVKFIGEGGRFPTQRCVSACNRDCRTSRLAESLMISGSLSALQRLRRLPLQMVVSGVQGASIFCRQ